MPVDVSRFKAHKRMTAQEVLFLIAAFERGIMKSDSKDFRSYPEACHRLMTVAIALRMILSKYFGKDLKLPVLPIVGAMNGSHELMEAALHAFCAELVQNLISAGCGKMLWHDKTRCSFDFPEAKFSYSLFKRKVTTVRCRHDLVDARQHILPCSVRRPPVVDQIIAAFPSPLVRHLRIVTGMEVVKSHAVESEHSGLNKFGQFVQDAAKKAGVAANAAGNAVTSAANSAGRGLNAAKNAIEKNPNVVAGVVGAAAAGGLGYWLLTAATVAAQVAIVDPALVLGDIVLCGWEN